MTTTPATTTTTATTVTTSPTTTATTVPTGPGLRLDAPSGPPGGRITARGSGCPASSDVVLEVGGAAVASVRAGTDGSFTSAFDLPRLPPGSFEVVARCGSTVLTTTVDVALSTVVEPATSTLGVLLLFVLSLAIVARRSAGSGGMARGG